jgi:hypothetical protein
MMTPERAELIDLIGKISAVYPEMRLGQLLCNLASMARGPQPESVWDVEDQEILTTARQLLEGLRERISIGMSEPANVST